MTPRLAAVFFALFASAAAAQSGPEGTYQGIITSAGIELAGETTFERRPDGAIRGSYVFDDQGQSAEGRLDDCALDDRLLTCMWRDAYGSGAFIVSFTPDFAQFEGSWYDPSFPVGRATLKGGFPWTGTRAGS